MTNRRSRSTRVLLAAGAAALVVSLPTGQVLGQTPTPPAVQAPAPADVDALARRAAERMGALQREADALASQERTLLGELRRLEIERDLRTEELAQAERALETVSREKVEAAARLAGLVEQVESGRPGVQGRLVEIYKLGRAGYLRLLFGVDDIRAAGRAYRTVAFLAHQDRVRAASYRATLIEMHATARQLEDRQVRARSLQEDAGRARAAAEKAVADRSALVDRIDSRRDLNAQLVGELDAARLKLRTMPLAASAAAAGPQPVLLPLRPFRGDLEWPVNGRLARRFGEPADARLGTTYQAGILVAAALDTPVHAIHEGVVAFAEPFAGFGNLVIVDHGNQAFSLYGHLSSLLVERGARVVHGQAVGAVGASPTGDPELYFELRIDGKPVDPVQWLKRER
jgi:septal ring factor EnvC (AmiA/AmiB activator)